MNTKDVLASQIPHLLFRVAVPGKRESRIRRGILFFASVLVTSAMPVAAEAYTLTTFGPGAFNADTAAMDASLGITGMNIEDFSDTTLISGLSIEFQNPDGGPMSVLPGNFSNPALEVESWDGNPVLINQPTQMLAASGGQYSDTTFRIAGGTMRFGIGLGDFQTYLSEANLLINGISFGNVSALPNYFDGPTQGSGDPPTRNLYLLVRAEAGDSPLTAITFDNLGAATDAHLFDHVAIDQVPAPATGLLLLTAFGAGISRARRRAPGTGVRNGVNA